MPNGHSYEDIPLDKQVKDLIENNHIHQKAIWKTLRLCSNLTFELQNIRKLANLPPKKYPRKIQVGSNSWDISPEDWGKEDEWFDKKD